MGKKLTILYVGSLNVLSNSYKRFKTLKAMGYEVMGINVDQYIYNSIFTKFHYHLNIGPGISLLNRTVRKKVDNISPDILLIDNKSYLTSFTIKRIKLNFPSTKIAVLITDDPCGRYKKTWRLYRRSVPFFDIHFVQRTTNVDELKLLGAKKVELCFRSFDPDFHKPMILNSVELRKHECSVGFIGTYAPEREEYIAFLIKNNIQVKIVGDGWPKGKYWEIIKPNYHGPSVYGVDYVKNIVGMDIALHFLRHENRDQQDSRTFEIPACGVFMLAEWSDLHEIFFKDGVEAVFFKTKEDLLGKVKFYLKHVEKRKEISKNGYNRSVASKYDHEGRLAKVIEQIIEL